MAKKKKLKKNKRFVDKKEKEPGRFALPERTKCFILFVLMVLAAVLVALSFFGKAGLGGQYFMKGFSFLFGKTVFVLPLYLVLTGLAFWRLRYRNRWPVILAFFLLIFGTSAIFECFNHEVRNGGWVGYLITFPFLKAFGLLATQIIFSAVILIGLVILWQFFYHPKSKTEEKPALIKRLFAPKFKVKPIEPQISPIETLTPTGIKEKASPFELKTRPIETMAGKDYRFPPVDLLESDKGVPTAGDIRINSTIIKRTLQNFDIQVEMSEVNTGPTVTQYTLKPAEGVKLSKITSLSNDLALALASHPIRIEAPIPGRPLVGIEVPNKTRTLVRLRNLIEHQNLEQLDFDFFVTPLGDKRFHLFQ